MRNVSLFKFLRQTSGTAAVAFGLMLPVIVGAVGMSLDLGRGYLVKSRLQHALDAAALAVAGSTGDEAALRERLQQFFDTNYPPNVLGFTYNLDMEIVGQDVRVWANASYDTVFMHFLGGDETIVMTQETVVTKEVSGLEVALVLDNTGSMSYTPDGAAESNMEALRGAAQTFVDTLTSDGTDTYGIKIGIVPFANSVNVGKYGLGLNPDDTPYDDGSEFVTLPAGVSYTADPNSSTNWYGCLIEHNAAGWDEDIDTNDPYPQDVSDDYEGPWDIYQYGSYRTTCTGSGRRRVCTTAWRVSSPNNSCPRATILPLSSDYDEITATIASMQAHGYTLGNVGTEWGYKLLSPEKPFTEGAAWDSNTWRKAIIIMTDGENTKEGNYSYFWRDSKNQLSTTDYDDRFLEVCTQLKENNVTVYTITFQSGGAVNQELFESCATSPSHYFHAPTQDELRQHFSTISGQLSNLHIKS